MVKFTPSLVGIAAIVSIVSANQDVWGQCGGIDWTGTTTCTAGNSCQYQNAHYSQCIPVSILEQSASVTSIVSSGSTPTISGGLPGATSQAKLNTVAKMSGKKYFGTATDNPELDDTAYTAILNDNRQFGQLTPANSMKWDATEPARGTFTFTEGDQIANLAKSNGQLLRGHNCVWHNQLPSWVTSGNFDAPTLQSIITTHCSTVVGHYKGQPITTRVNIVSLMSHHAEPFNDDGTFQTDVFFETLNTSYITTALNAAKAADPSTKLYINEFNIEFEGTDSTAMQNLIKSLKSAGTQIDGIGMQFHMIVGELPGGLASNMQAFASLGVEVAITELDIRMTLPATAALYEQQKADYQTVISACQSVSECIGITIWDWTDEFSWIPGTFAGQGAACPWDATFLRKPAFDGIVAGF
ncbi:beta-1,4-endoxylanase [Artomyces pyxidatus]|uniref:Beta-1,4-endoxylanase n=1 Tax=Artomyces pyxidatus TaxID=48021 RepID=A0ACB8TFU2_9AGAM|nr:beta-1,4-endoxylanase [Artomyces pyxidatus]